MDNGILWEVTFVEFILVTILLGGAAAYMTGRSVALSWQENRLLFFYVVLLTLAVRFIHFSLFSGSLLSAYYYFIDLIVLVVIAFIGKRQKRADQMSTQYSFEFSRNGPFNWKKVH